MPGDATVDCVLGDGYGQYVNVSMATDNAGNYFNLLAPEEKDVAFFNGSVGENQYEGILPASGDCSRTDLPVTWREAHPPRERWLKGPRLPDAQCRAPQRGRELPYRDDDHQCLKG